MKRRLIYPTENTFGGDPEFAPREKSLIFRVGHASVSLGDGIPQELLWKTRRDVRRHIMGVISRFRVSNESFLFYASVCGEGVLLCKPPNLRRIGSSSHAICLSRPHFFSPQVPHPLETQKRTGTELPVPVRFGVPGGIRTHDLPLRRRTLYPAELRKHLADAVLF